jgi:methylenetetrahydrofolate dehydrogenase (NADP+) / methenyltetrahydrofolate cyclohydrolase
MFQRQIIIDGIEFAKVQDYDDRSKIMTKKLRAKPMIKKIYAEIREEIDAKNLSPRLDVIILGEDPASLYYVQNLQKKGEKIGIEVNALNLDPKLSQENLLAKIDEMNNNPKVSGVMLQKPLPNHLNETEIVNAINPKKDVDGFHPVNMGKLVLDEPGFVPCTPAACIEMMKFYEIETSGKNVVIIGRSNIVGKPLANLLLRKDKYANATVTVCHSRTQNLAEISKQADILISAIGIPFFVKEGMIKKDAIVIDVGVNQIEDVEKGFRYVGDVDYEACFEKSSEITPVPGGVGSVTTSMLLKNVLIASQNL